MRDIKEVLSTRWYKLGYHVVTYIADGSKYGGADFEMKTAFTNNNLEYIGESQWAYKLTHKFGLSRLQSIKGRDPIKKRAVEEEAKRLLLKDFMTDYSFYPVNLGFSENEQKWYGWSHRAMSRFGIGSSIKPGDCAYKPYNKEDFMRESIDFWTSEYHENVKVEKEDTLHNKEGIWISWIFSNDTPNKTLRGSVEKLFVPYPEIWGKGSWTAQSLDDAKQMAIDFAEQVS